MELQSKNSPTFGNIQVEVTSRCNLRCRTCLYAYFEPQWIPLDMPDRVLNNIYAAAHHCRSIHLQGWGESLLRQDLPDIVRKIRKDQCLVTLSTNGSVLDSGQVEDLVSAGIDSMAFSLAGPGQETHDRLKGKGTFTTLLETIACFRAVRKTNTKPKLVLNYLLTPENVGRLNKVMSLGKKVGADTVVGTHMVHVATRAQAEMIAYNRDKAHRLSFFLARTSVLWKRVGLVLPPMQDTLMPVCAKNPVQNLFVASDGSVAPCVYLAPPLAGGFSRLFEGKGYASQRVVMGNLHDCSLETIWDYPEYRAFRDCFQRRIDLYQKLMPDTRPSFQGLERLESAVRKLERHYQEDAFLPPEPCRICAAVNGL